MTIRFEVTGESVAEFKQNFGAILGVFLPLLRTAPPVAPAEGRMLSPEELKPEVEEPAAEQPVEQAKEEAPPKADKKKAKDKPKQVDLEEAIAEKLTVEDVRSKLKALGEKKGHDAVFKLLETYGAKNASTVPVDKYAELIGKVDETLGG